MFKSDTQVYRLLEHLQDDLKRITKFKTHAYQKNPNNLDSISKDFKQSEENIQSLITSYVENFTTSQLSEYFKYKSNGDSKVKELFSKSKIPTTNSIKPSINTSKIKSTTNDTKFKSGRLLVNIISLKHLPLRKFKKKVNPFIVLKLNSKIKMTDQHFGESDPVFDRYFKFKTKGDNDKLKLFVYHKSNKTKLIGQLEIRIEDIAENGNRLYKSMFINDKNSTVEFDIILINR